MAPLPLVGKNLGFVDWFLLADCITGKSPSKHFVQSGKMVQSMVVCYASFVVEHAFASFSGSLRPLASQSQYVFSGQKKGTLFPHCLCDGRRMSQLGSPGNVEASGLSLNELSWMWDTQNFRMVVLLHQHCLDLVGCGVRKLERVFVTSSTMRCNSWWCARLSWRKHGDNQQVHKRLPLQSRRGRSYNNPPFGRLCFVLQTQIQVRSCVLGGYNVPPFGGPWNFRSPAVGVEIP